MNWWHWEGELTDEENHNAGLRYKNEINKIKNLNFDVSFVPLDPRQGQQYSLGFDTFMKTVNTKYVFPMHLWKDHTIINKILSDKCSEDYRKKIINITKEPEKFILD